MRAVGMMGRPGGARLAPCRPACSPPPGRGVRLPDAQPPSTHLFRNAFDGVEEALDAVFGVNVASTACRVTMEDSQTSPALDPVVR